MTGIDALELLKNNSKVYRGYFKSESDAWYVKYSKENKSFEFGPGWNEALKNRSNTEILNFIFYTICFDEWQKSSE